MAKTVTSGLGAGAPPEAKPRQAVTIESVMAAAGLNAGDARGKLVGLAGTFPDGIPDAALQRWADEFLGSSRQFWLALGRAWEKGK